MQIGNFDIIGFEIGKDDNWKEVKFKNMESLMKKVNKAKPDNKGYMTFVDCETGNEMGYEFESMEEVSQVLDKLNDPNIDTEVKDGFFQVLALKAMATGKSHEAHNMAKVLGLFAGSDTKIMGVAPGTSMTIGLGSGGMDVMYEDSDDVNIERIGDNRIEIGDIFLYKVKVNVLEDGNGVSINYGLEFEEAYKKLNKINPKDFYSIEITCRNGKVPANSISNETCFFKFSLDKAKELLKNIIDHLKNDEPKEIREIIKRETAYWKSNIKGYIAENYKRVAEYLDYDLEGVKKVWDGSFLEQTFPMRIWNANQELEEWAECHHIIFEMDYGDGKIIEEKFEEVNPAWGFLNGYKRAPQIFKRMNFDNKVILDVFKDALDFLGGV